MLVDRSDGEFWLDECRVAGENFHDGLHDFDGRGDSHWKAIHLEETTCGVNEAEPTTSEARDFELVEARFCVGSGGGFMGDLIQVEGDVAKVGLARVATLEEVVVTLGPVDEAKAIVHGTIFIDLCLFDDECAATILGGRGVGGFGDIGGDELVDDARGAVWRRNDLIRSRKLRMSDEAADLIEALLCSWKKTRLNQVDVRRRDRFDGKGKGVSFSCRWPAAAVRTKSDGVLEIGTSRLVGSSRFDDGRTC